MMTDRELCEFLWKLLSNDLFDGDVPTDNELKKIEYEFKERGYLEEDEELIEY